MQSPPDHPAATIASRFSLTPGGEQNIVPFSSHLVHSLVLRPSAGEQLSNLHRGPFNLCRGDKSAKVHVVLQGNTSAGAVSVLHEGVPLVVYDPDARSMALAIVEPSLDFVDLSDNKNAWPQVYAPLGNMYHDVSSEKVDNFLASFMQPESESVKTAAPSTAATTNDAAAGSRTYPYGFPTLLPSNDYDAFLQSETSAMLDNMRSMSKVKRSALPRVVPILTLRHVRAVIIGKVNGNVEVRRANDGTQCLTLHTSQTTYREVLLPPSIVFCESSLVTTASVASSNIEDVLSILGVPTTVFEHRFAKVYELYKALKKELGEDNVRRLRDEGNQLARENKSTAASILRRLHDEKNSSPRWRLATAAAGIAKKTAAYVYRRALQALRS